MTDSINYEDKLIKDIKYHFGIRSAATLYPLQISLHPNAKEVLDEVITYLESRGNIEQCPECKGAKRFGFSIDGTGEVGLVNCNTCDGRGTVPKGTKSNPLGDKQYYALAYQRVMG